MTDFIITILFFNNSGVGWYETRDLLFTLLVHKPRGWLTSASRYKMRSHRRIMFGDYICFQVTFCFMMEIIFDNL